MVRKRKKYNKLVRDKIPEYIRSKGGRPTYHVADDIEYWQKLKAKLVEEVNEFEQDESIEEFADVMEVVDAIARYKKFDEKEVQRVRNKKARERGRFKIRLILDES